MFSEKLSEATDDIKAQAAQATNPENLMKAAGMAAQMHAQATEQPVAPAQN